MVSDQRFQQYRCLIVEAGIGIPAVDAHPGTMNRTVKQSDIADGTNSQVLHQRQNVLEGEVLNHWPNRSFCGFTQLMWPLTRPQESSPSGPPAHSEPVVGEVVCERRRLLQFGDRTYARRGPAEG